ncbi:MAG: oligosaccharide flippase family protein [Tannerellaceae bacterium]|nr:oligosaccharide flippase family protein [Tannerellaceae bacterium]
MKALFSSELKRNAFRLLSANVLSQFIGLAVYPVVTRLYSPEEFGLFNIFTTLCGILFVLSTARYEYAIVLPRSTKDAAALVRLCMRIAFLFSLILLLLIIVFHTQILALFHMESLGILLYLVPLLVVLNAAGLTCMYWFNRLKKFNLVGRYWMSQNIVNSSLKVVLGAMKYTGSGLIYSYFAGFLAAVCSFFLFVNNEKSIRLWISVRQEQIRKVAKVYQNYPKYNLLHALTNIVSTGFPILIFGHFFGNEIVGYYGLAFLIGFRPINLVTTSLYQVLYQKISDLCNKRQPVYSLFKRFCIQATGVLLPSFILIYFISTPVIRYLFGADWIEAASILKILLPWLGACFISGIFEFIPFLFSRQRKALSIEICYALSRLSAIFIGVYMNDFYISLMAYASISFFFKVYQWVWYRKLVRSYERSR